MSNVVWGHVLIHECWIFPGDKEDFWTGRSQKVAAGICGDTLLIVLGGNSSDHSFFLRKGCRHFNDKHSDLSEDPVWTGGAFIEYLNKAKELNIWGDSTTLEGSLTPEVEEKALEVISEFEWLKPALS